jgi:hypothetical protein
LAKDDGHRPVEVVMVLVIEEVRPESDAFGPIPLAPKDTDVPGLMADLVGKLYAEEERVTRLARTESLIRAAEELR